MTQIKLNYRPRPVPMLFHRSVLDKSKVVRMLCGPFGSGKSVTCVNELMYIAMRQAPAADGIRRTRMGVVRATYPALVRSTLKTLRQWMPEQMGKIRETVPMSGLFQFPLSDGTRVHMELEMVAAQDESDAEKLRSTDFTAIWINEATEVTPDILAMAIERTGRYPLDEHLGRCTWSGVLLDFNKPPAGHWLYGFLESGPEMCAYFEQPPAMFKHVAEDGTVTYELNPAADNLDILPEGYYQNQYEMHRSTGNYDKIDQLLCMLKVESVEGKPVFTNFSREQHISDRPLVRLNNQDVLIGIDTSGIHPAAVVAQFNGRQWAIADELYGDGTGFEDFIYGSLLPLLSFRYQGCRVTAVCDPANARNSFNATTPVQNLIDANIPAVVAPTNREKQRIEAGNQLLSRTTGGILISPECERLINALSGGYRYRKLRVSGTMGVAYSPHPEDNEHTHIADAFEYMCLHILREDKVGSADWSVIREAMHRRTRWRLM